MCLHPCGASAEINALMRLYCCVPDTREEPMDTCSSNLILGNFSIKFVDIFQNCENKKQWKWLTIYKKTCVCIWSCCEQNSLKYLSECAETLVVCLFLTNFNKNWNVREGLWTNFMKTHQTTDFMKVTSAFLELLHADTDREELRGEFLQICVENATKFCSLPTCCIHTLWHNSQNKRRLLL
jgi:hypothetical protein